MRKPFVGLLLTLFALSVCSKAQETSIRGFADANFGASDQKTEHPAFSIGQYDWYVTSEITDRISFLGESVFEWNGTDFNVDVERIVLKYTFTDYFKVQVGKHHSPIGYWNNAYHHGTVLQPTTIRPLLYFFEDDGGILPIHNTGVWFSGAGITSANLGYDILIGNGVGGNPASDNNNTKSVTARFFARPADGLEFGVSGNTDKISAGTNTLGGAPLSQNVKQMILNGYAVYFKDNIEFAAEYTSIANTPDVGSTVQNSGMYAYGGYRIGSLVPYVRYDMLTFGTGDPYFTNYALNVNTKMIIAGVRYEVSPLAVVKLEYHNVDAAGSPKRNELTTQFSIGF